MGCVSWCGTVVAKNLGKAGLAEAGCVLDWLSLREGFTMECAQVAQSAPTVQAGRTCLHIWGPALVPSPKYLVLG